jgi:hypothetical protein
MNGLNGHRIRRVWYDVRDQVLNRVPEETAMKSPVLLLLIVLAVGDQNLIRATKRATGGCQRVVLEGRGVFQRAGRRRKVPGWAESSLHYGHSGTGRKENLILPSAADREMGLLGGDEGVRPRTGGCTGGGVRQPGDGQPPCPL